MALVYQTIKKNITNGLYGANKDALGTGGYLILRKAPAGANVQIQLNDNQGASKITLGEGDSIKLAEAAEMFVYADPVENGILEFNLADSAEDFEITPAPAIKDIEEIGSFGAALLAELDKIANPYEFSALQQGTHFGSTSLVTIYSAVLDCDLIDLSLLGGGGIEHGNAMQYGTICANLNGIPLLSSFGYNGTTGTGIALIKMDNVRGKTLTITARHGSTSTSYVSFFNLTKYTKKA